MAAAMEMPGVRNVAPEYGYFIPFCRQDKSGLITGLETSRTL